MYNFSIFSYAGEKVYYVKVSIPKKLKLKIKVPVSWCPVALEKNTHKVKQDTTYKISKK